ncbi:MAG: L,D-transpeptidase/peptidoglycan binding protein [Pseudobutyrivibrio sp.]|nr:L,D-transpeptidase/peptidoglycan binding protein [Pseudobutyrivibrio sp.]
MSVVKKAKARKVVKNKLDMKKIAIVAGAILLVYLVGSIYFRNHFYIRSTVNGVGASFKTAEAVYDKINDSANVYTISFINADGDVVNEVSSDTLGVEVNYDVDQVQELLDKQTGFNWVGRIFSPIEYYTKTGNSYDEAKVKEVAGSLDFSMHKATVDSQDAYINFNGSEFEIVDEVYGDTIDQQGVEDAIIYAVENLKTEINISDGTCYHKPHITSDNPKMQAALETLNKYMGTQIHYDLGEGITEEIPAETKATWFTWDDDFNVSFNNEAIGEFVDSMCDKYNTYGKKREFTATSGEQVTIPGGSYGWKISHDGEVNQIIADLTAGEDVTRDFVYHSFVEGKYCTAASHGEHDYAGSYVEVNLTEQHVYVYKDGAMVFDTPCVTGKISNNHGTHPGIFPIAFKQSPAKLRGEDYVSKVRYWMPFNDGQGLHDADWRHEFGGTLYKTGGSHGCVNLPVKSAETIYGIVEAGWPVIVFYTGSRAAEDAALASQTPEAKVIQRINEIGEVTIEKEAAIAGARQAFNALTEEQKASVTNYQVLCDAEVAVVTLKQQAGIPAPEVPVDGATPAPEAIQQE